MAESEFKLQGLTDAALEKIKTMGDADTVIGTHIKLDDGIVIIPISKVKYGFTAGGTDWPSKSINQKMFGGGSGAGVTVEPVGFIVVNGNDVKLLQITNEPSTASGIIQMVPELFDKITDFVKKDKTDKKIAEEKASATAKYTTKSE